MKTTSFAHQLTARAALPRLSVGMTESVNIGFLGPLSGRVESWGLPGLNGCRIWEDGLNKAGGVLVGGRRYPIRIHSYDCGYNPDRALEGAVELVQKHNVKLMLMLGGDTFAPVQDFLMRNKVLTSTLLPTDLSPDTPYLIAPSEAHPIQNVTGVAWLAENRPELKTVALCSQMDLLGLPTQAVYRAAFKAAGKKILREVQYDARSMDPGPVVDPMLESGADILCWCSSYTPMVHAMTEYAYAKGFKGQIISCTMDGYGKLVEKTSEEFMEGVLFQFPDFDDPLLREKAFFFNQPHTFYEEYNRRFPGSWSAVSWEYVAILDIWHSAVEKAGSVESPSVLAAMKQLGHVTHAFGHAEWWGEEIFGISNALVGDWPVVTIQEGKARIAGFGSIPGWLAQHSNLLKAEMAALGQLWHQRLESAAPGNEASARAVLG